MEPQRTKIDAQERAHIEALLRRNASPDELNAWRSERRIHHKTFAALVRALRQGLDAPPSPAAVQISALEPVALAASTDEPPAVITAAPTPTRPAQIQPVIDWLATVRAMRDELAVHGVTVAGSLRIEIEV